MSQNRPRRKRPLLQVRNHQGLYIDLQSLEELRGGLKNGWIKPTDLITADGEHGMEVGPIEGIGDDYVEKVKEATELLPHRRLSNGLPVGRTELRRIHNEMSWA